MLISGIMKVRSVIIPTPIPIPIPITITITIIITTRYKKSTKRSQT